jgi:signal transducing adaptor molecule
MSLAKLINKATDPKLIQDNWQYNLDVCDKILEDPENNCSQAIDIIGEKLQQRDGNVLLRTLSLLVAIGENCGSRAQQLIATRSFTQVLLSKLRDPQTHKEIKTKVANVLSQLNNSFQKDPSLKPVMDAYQEVKHSFPQYLPPAKPAKRELEDEDEDADLRTAIELSLKESQVQQQQQQAQPVQPVQQAPQLHLPVQKQQPAQERTFSRVRALYDSFSTDPADLKFHKGDIITVIERVYKDWGKGSLRGVVGLFPFNYVTPLYDPTAQELMEERLKEQEIFQRGKGVEKLLVLLSRASTDEESFQLTQSEEFKRLYQQVVLIKPELATLIDKYRQRKDDLMDMYGKLKSATATYEELTDPVKQYQPQAQSYQPQQVPHQVPQHVPPQQQAPQQQQQQQAPQKQQQFYPPYPR